MRYGIQHLQNQSIVHSHDTLFDYDNFDRVDFDATGDRDLSPTFTTTITYLTPDDPLYHAVTKYALLEKERAVIAYGSTATPRTPPRTTLLALIPTLPTSLPTPQLPFPT